MSVHIVLGRFQPFHLGHEFLVEFALEKAGSNGSVTIAIGSANAELNPENPWDAKERILMCQVWAKANGHNINIVCIDDINDPPNWVEHATITHGEGILVTSDGPTSELYCDAGWDVVSAPMSQRQSHEGWRVRETLKMLCNIGDNDALRKVMGATMPSSVIEWLLEDDERIRRLAFLGPSVEHVG